MTDLGLMLFFALEVWEWNGERVWQNSLLCHTRLVIFPRLVG